MGFFPDHLSVISMTMRRTVRRTMRRRMTGQIQNHVGKQGAGGAMDGHEVVSRFQASRVMF